MNVQTCLLSKLVFGQEWEKGQAENTGRCSSCSSCSAAASGLPLAIILANITTTHLCNTLCELFDQHRRQIDRQIEELRYIAEAWSASGVESLLIKGAGYMPYTSSNVDVLVRNTDLPTAARLLEDLGYFELRYLREPYKRLYRKVRSPSLGFAVHLHTSVAWISEFIDGASCFLNGFESEVHPSIRYPSPEDWLLINTAHWVYEDKALSLRDVYNTYRTLSQNPCLDWDYMLRKSSERGWGAGFAFGLTVFCEAEMAMRGECLLRSEIQSLLRVTMDRVLTKYVGELFKKGQISLPLQLSKIVLKAAHLNKTLIDSQLGLGGRLSDLSKVVWYAARNRLHLMGLRRSMTVSISGIDGAGKTTLAESLASCLSQFGVRARVRWLRIGASSPIDLLRRLVRATPISGLHTLEHDGTAGSSVLHRVWALFLAMEFSVRVYALDLTRILVGGVTIYDRHVSDAAVDLMSRYDLRGASTLLKILPRPDLTILIRVGWDEATMRSETPTSYRYVDKLYDGLLPQYDIVLDGREDAGQLLELALSSVLGRYFE